MLWSEAVFAAVSKVFSTVASRRFLPDLRECVRRGYISRTIKHASIANYLARQEMTELLVALIKISATPLREIETNFALDSSGFTGSALTSWYDRQYRGLYEKRYVIVHLGCGIRTHIVGAAIIEARDRGDTKVAPALLQMLNATFNVTEVYADAGYSSVEVHEQINNIGAVPFIAFKTNSTGRRGGVYRNSFLFYQLHKEEFMKRYHKRSNVESVFSMMKRKFGPSLRSKTEVAMVNEAYCKILCHNICCLIHSNYELGLDITQFAERSDAN